MRVLIQIREVTAPPDDEGVTEPVRLYLTATGRDDDEDNVGDVWRCVERSESYGTRWSRNYYSVELLFDAYRVLCCCPTGPVFRLRVTAPNGQVRLTDSVSNCIEVKSRVHRCRK